MERELVEQAMRGDHAAFASLVRASTPRLLGLARIILKDDALAEDAVQDALLAAWRDIHGLRDPGAWHSWVQRLTVRICYRMAGRRRGRMRFEIPLGPWHDRPSHTDVLAWLVDREALMAAMDVLPVEQRAVLAAHFYLDLPIAEAAAVLGIPVGTCKSRLARALMALRVSMIIAPRASWPVARERTR